MKDCNLELKLNIKVLYTVVIVLNTYYISC